ncbi:MAG: exosortase/archaeosortase family protein [Longimicrobiales bacterium]
MAFTALNAAPLAAMVRDWWTNPEAAHGLLLAPLALILAWRTGIGPRARAQPWLGLTVLTTAVGIRYMADLAAEFYSLRVSILLMVAGLVIFSFGLRQLIRWWLPAALLLLTIPLPQFVLAELAFPLQLKASALGSALLAWRDVPVSLAGNVLQLPGQRLFVTEACSGLRSLSALLALGLLMGAFWLRSPFSRLLILLLAIPVAVVLNGIRVFLTGYLVYYVNPTLGSGLMHWTEGWVLFLVAFGVVGGLTAMLSKVEQGHLARAR